jgi:predicted ATP-dependent endonuclease of OLD family
MRLESFHVKDFQSVRDSGLIPVDQITCLVGKNEAGKSALLKALYRLNPLVKSEGKFDVTIDYPRMDVEDYRHDVERKKREIARPITANYRLEEPEISAIANVFGKDALKDTQFVITKDYENNRTIWLSLDSGKALAHLLASADISQQLRDSLLESGATIAEIGNRLKAQEQTAEVSRLSKLFEQLQTRGLIGYIFDTFINGIEPRFLYFDEYYQMTGHENIEALVQRVESKTQVPSDHPMLGLIRLARLNLTDLLKPENTINLKGKLEGASNHLTGQVLKYWSQNKHLRMTFDVRPGLPGDPEGMRTGTNIWGGVYDSRHSVTTELGSRSRGFVWFFSFLAWYSDVKRDEKPVILLLDEPGLTLHAKAQEDLLRYFETELRSAHQLIYSTHSPFMIDARHLDRVRVVQDIDAENDGGPQGTTVLKDLFGASEDSLFPLQGALGYDIHQTLFVGPRSLVVEGVADLLFLQTMSALLESQNRVGLDARWTITPVGGASKVPTFVALLGSQKGMTVATLIDKQVSDQKTIEDLYKNKLLKKANVFTFADFLETSEADIEDMFGQAFYLKLVNEEFSSQLSAPIKPASLKSKNPRVLVRIEEYLVGTPLKSGKFGHFRPARYFSENISTLSKGLPSSALDNFEKAFIAVNKLLD